jgi:hypothetical protein
MGRNIGMGGEMVKVSVGFAQTINLETVFGPQFSFNNVKPSISLSDEPQLKEDGTMENQHECYMRVRRDAEMLFRKEVNAQITLAKTILDENRTGGRTG